MCDTPPEDVIRVLRVIEYVGTRTMVEKTLRHSIYGCKEFRKSDGQYMNIYASTVGQVPEIRSTIFTELQPTYIPDDAEERMNKES